MVDENYPIIFKILIDIFHNNIQSISLNVKNGSLEKIDRNVIKIPEYKYWISLYRKTKILKIKFFELFEILFSDKEFFLSLTFYHLILSEREKLDIMRQYYFRYYLATEEEKIKIIEEKKFIEKQLTKEINDIQNEKYINLSKDEILSIISREEILFFKRVLFPCLLNYGDFPSRILKRARSGDEKTIKFLLTIDKTIQYDKYISKYINDLSFKNIYKYQKIIKSLSEIDNKITSKDLKYKYCGLINKFSRQYENISGIKRLKTTKIRGFLDSSAKNKFGSDDSDITCGIHGFYKALYRDDHDFWQIFKDPDKK